MENLSFYLVMLLAGIIIGGIIVGALLAPLTQPRLPGYQLPAYAGTYEYNSYTARRPTAMVIAILSLLFLLALIFLGLRREQNSRPIGPAPMERTIDYPGVEAAQTL